MNLDYKIIDFHTHPFENQLTNICMHSKYFDMNKENTKSDLQKLGIKKICGSVAKRFDKNFSFDNVKQLNDEALRLQECYNGFYYPGFHIHPKYVKESIEEIERMNKKGIKLIGELVHYHQFWNDYSDKNLWEILECAEHYNMIVDFHGLADTEEIYCSMDKMVHRFKNLKIVGAHPSEGRALEHHILRLTDSENYYVDTSGGGISRHGLTKRLITMFSKDRILFGSDFPVCSASMFVGGIALDYLLSEDEKQSIFYKNAEKLLNIKI